MSYLLLSAVFLALATVMLVIALVSTASRRALVLRWWLPLVVAGVVVMTLTAVFDNVMIGAGLIQYSPARISGLFVGVAPIEDFSYPLAALILLPALWLLLRTERSKDGL